MESNKKRKKGAKIRKDRVAILLLFIIWTVVSGIFISKVAGPTVDLAVARDNYSYVEQYGNPSNWEAKDSTYKSYNELANSMINSNDKVLSTYAKQNGGVKMLMLALAFAPYIIIISFIISCIEEDKKEKKRKYLKKRARKVVRNETARI
jgi:hypothetical protein